jgi:SAM-dependent methyltransferase
VAPEPALAARLRRRLGARHVTTDLEPGRVDVRADVTRLPHRDATFDVVYCSHVLEHVVDDAGALREFRRVLVPGGRAVLMVPITRERTDEDPTVTDPRARLARFGQADHVRRYGADFGDRVRDAGFQLARIGVDAVATPAEVLTFGLTPASGDVWLGIRPGAPSRG